MKVACRTCEAAEGEVRLVMVEGVVLDLRRRVVRVGVRAMGRVGSFPIVVTGGSS